MLLGCSSNGYYKLIARKSPKHVNFNYSESFQKPVPEAYERLILDCMRGNPTLFARKDSVEQAWAWVTPIIQTLEAGKGGPMHTYPKQSTGPEAARDIMARDGRRWTELK